MQAFDRYAYVGNNPLRYTDPTGHNFWDTVRGFTVGLVSEVIRTNFGFIPQVQEALAVNSSESQATIAGRVVGDVVNIAIGVAEVGEGITIGTGGTVASCLGTACVAAVVTVGAGVAVSANGATVVLNAAASLGNNLSLMSGNSGSVGLFEKNGVKTSDHFFDRMNDWGLTEDQAYKVYQSGKKYTDADGQLLRYDPKSGITVLIDPIDGEVVTTWVTDSPSSSWTKGWETGQ